MKDITFETAIVAANPHSDQTNNFVTLTMQQIKQRAPLASRLPAPQKRSLIGWLRHLHRPTLALLILIAITLVSGAVYAAVHFAPALIQLVGKETGSRGATVYAFSGFTDCSKSSANEAERFEMKTMAASMSDEDVQKTIQAKCEMAWVNDFVARTWPRQDSDANLKEGDKLYYTRVDVMGTVKSLNDSKYIVDLGDNTFSEHSVASGEKLKAYLGGTEIPLSDVKNDDLVFTIVRVSEIFHDYRNCRSNPKSTNTNPCPTTNNMKVESAVAVFKMSLPEKYYKGDMQNSLTELPVCIGNPNEFCPVTPSIDVYPRSGGEGAANPYFNEPANPIVRHISGQVTQLSDDTLTLKARSGTLYTVTVGDAGFTVYNRDYTGDYTTIDATLKIGSNVMVMYLQPEGADPTKITKEQVQRVNLQLEALNPKKGNVKQY